MNKTLSLRTALAASLSVHLLFISAWDAPFFSWFKGKGEIKRNEIEVTYVVRKLAEEPELKAIPKKYDLEQKKTVMTGRDMAKKREKPFSSADPNEKSVFIEEKTEAADIRNLEEYIAYYELLREKIKKEVSTQYTRPIREGIVHLIFKLRKDGEIQKILVDESRSTDSKFLKRIGIKSLKGAAPFPPFPQALKREELVFNISIIFKRE